MENQNESSNISEDTSKTDETSIIERTTEENSARQRKAFAEPEDKNILKILSDMQSEINSLKSELEKSDKESLAWKSKFDRIVDLLNEYRLGMYLPSSFDAIDANEYLRKNKFNLTEIAGRSLEQAMLVHKVIIELAAFSSDLVEDARAKAPIKIKNKKQADDKLKEVKDLRDATSVETKAKKIIYSEAEKIINGFRKRMPSASVTQLIPLIKAMSPIKDDSEIRALFDSIFAKEQSKKKGK